MFRRLTRLLFGAEEEVSEDVKAAEVVDDGWLVVPHQEATSSENPDVQQTNSAANMESDGLLAAESSALPSSTNTHPALSASSSKLEALTELTQFTCVQKTQAWPAQRHASRNAIQRQNRVRQGVQPHAFHLQQPGHRSLSH